MHNLLSRFDADADSSASIQMVPTSSTANSFAAGPQAANSSHPVEYNDGALPRAATAFKAQAFGHHIGDGSASNGDPSQIHVSVHSDAGPSPDQLQADHEVAALHAESRVSATASI